MASSIQFDLRGQVAFITGATSGFGERFAEILSEAGAKVVITGRRESRLIAVKEKIEKAGGTCVVIPLDVTNVAQIKAVVAQAERLAGPISILVNNAGLNIQSSVVSLTEADYDTIMNTNVKGMYFVAQAVAARMIEHKLKGRIVNVASIGALKPLPGLVTYSMSKAAVGMMTKGMAREWARSHIAVNAVCPGFIKTELNAEWFATEGGQKQINGFPRRRLGAESDLDALVLLLCSEHAGFITGSLFTIDDGQVLT
jgi:NAD(P)-dependent dehydrogenase (short-subunit alcohol dehydrogenase family)